MPHLLQEALSAREFSDVIVFRSPPFLVQRALFGLLMPIARLRGYRATYPEISRTAQASAGQSGISAGEASHKVVAISDVAL
jgi:hypothetical protein